MHKSSSGMLRKESEAIIFLKREINPKPNTKGLGFGEH